MWNLLTDKGSKAQNNSYKSEIKRLCERRGGGDRAMEVAKTPLLFLAWDLKVRTIGLSIGPSFGLYWQDLLAPMSPTPVRAGELEESEWEQTQPSSFWDTWAYSHTNTCIHPSQPSLLRITVWADLQMSPVEWHPSGKRRWKNLAPIV